MTLVEDDIIDFSQYFPEEDEFINLYEFSPIHPYRLIAVGPSGSGKTNVIVDMLTRKVYFDNLYIIAGDPEDKFYQLLETIINDTNEHIESGDIVRKNGPICFEISDDINFDTEKLARDKQNIVIVDDKVCEKHQEAIAELFIRIRKLNGSVIYITQSFYETPKIMRDNSNYIFLFNLNDEQTSNRILRDKCVGYLDKAKSIYKEVHKEPYKFMMIDNKKFNLRNCYKIL